MKSTKLKDYSSVMVKKTIIRISSLSVLQMPLDDPPVLQERIGALIVPEVYSLSSVTHNVPRPRIDSRSIPH